MRRPPDTTEAAPRPVRARAGARGRRDAAAAAVRGLADRAGALRALLPGARGDRVVLRHGADRIRGRALRGVAWYFIVPPAYTWLPRRRATWPRWRSMRSRRRPDPVRARGERRAPRAARLVRARARLAAIVESSDDAIIGKDLTVHPVLERRRRAHVRLPRRRDHRPAGHDADPAPSGTTRRTGSSRRCAAASGSSTSRRSRCARTAGGSRCRSRSPRSATRHGEIIGASKVARDITERKRAERAARAAAGVVPRSRSTASATP